MWLLHSNSILGSREIQYHKKIRYSSQWTIDFFMCKQTADFSLDDKTNTNNDTAF